MHQYSSVTSTNICVIHTTTYVCYWRKQDCGRLARIFLVVDTLAGWMEPVAGVAVMRVTIHTASADAGDLGGLGDLGVGGGHVLGGEEHRRYD